MTIMNDLRMNTYHPNYRFSVKLVNLQYGTFSYFDSIMDNLSLDGLNSNYKIPY